MPATLKSIRENTDIGPTPEDKGLQMTITVKAYDNGLITVDDRPINRRCRQAAMTRGTAGSARLSISSSSWASSVVKPPRGRRSLARSGGYSAFHPASGPSDP